MSQRAAEAPMNWFRQGLFAPVTEEVTAFDLRDGGAEWYRNRWVRSKAVAEALGEKWREGPVRDHDFASNTHILAHAGRILATVEGGALPYEITDELSTVGPYDFAGALPAAFARTRRSTCGRARFTPSRIRIVRIMSSTSSSTRLAD